MVNLFGEKIVLKGTRGEFVQHEFVSRSYHNSFALRLLVVKCVEPLRWENKVGFPETPFCVFFWERVSILSSG